MATAIEALLDEGREATARGDGAAAREAFAASLRERETGAGWEGLGRAAYLELEYPAAIEAHERAFAAYRRERRLLDAARAARMLAWLHLNISGEWAVANGWIARGETVLAAAPADTAEHGWATLFRTMAVEDHARREAGFREALASGRRHGDVDLEFEALGWVGLEHVFTDRVEEGLHQLDQALTAICAGEVDDLYVVEGVFCAMLLACERAHDVVRAEQWLRAGDALAERRHQPAIGAFCRSYLGGILTAAGRWPEAERALLGATGFFDRGFSAARETALIRFADLRVRQGRIEEAAQMLDGLDLHPDATRTVAALHYARGDLPLARDVIERALRQPGLESAVESPLRALLVDVLLAEGSIDEAGAQAELLGAIAERHPQPYLRASAALAMGKVRVASRTGDARGSLLEALEAFDRAQMPVDLAHARLQLARLHASDRPEVAIAEARAALEAFEGLEAARDADAAAALVRELGGPARTGPRRRTPLTRREAEVLDLLALGLSNPEIGVRLHISRKTAEHHVGEVLGKLGLRNRAEAAAYAARRGDNRGGA